MKRAPMYMFSELLEVTSGSGRASLTTVRSISQHTHTHTHTHTLLSGRRPSTKRAGYSLTLNGFRFRNSRRNKTKP